MSDLNTSSKADLNQSNLQKSLNNIQRWCSKWRIKINPQKSNYTVFKNDHKLKGPDNPIITFFDNCIPNTKEAKFLGVIFDERLTFKSHTDKITAKA